MSASMRVMRFCVKNFFCIIQSQTLALLSETSYYNDMKSKKALSLMGDPAPVAAVSGGRQQEQSNR